VGAGTELTDDQRRSLAANGYLLIPSVLATDAVDRLADRLEQLVRATVEAFDASPDARWEEAGVVRLRLDLDDTGFAELVRQPLLFSAAQAVIGPGYVVNGLNLRAPLPGCGHQRLHPDFHPGHRTDGPWQVLAGMWCITEFTDYNGPLRVLPGSHRSTTDPATT
jgi:ectoine hydroxylase-related dioxygenase (phytanoyl-CoA dioxygenase family)